MTETTRDMRRPPRDGRTLVASLTEREAAWVAGARLYVPWTTDYLLSSIHHSSIRHCLEYYFTARQTETYTETDAEG